MTRKNPSDYDRVDVDTTTKCKCDNRKEIVVNHDISWHDGHVICKNCLGFIRFYDGG